MDLIAQYRQYLDNVLGLIVIDTECKVVFINAQCSKFLRVDNHTAIGKPIDELFPESDMPAMLRSGQEVETGYYFVGGHITCSTRKKIRDENGVIVGVLEYDWFQDANSLDWLIDDYTDILNESIAKYKQMSEQVILSKYSINSIIGSSVRISELKNNIIRVADTNSSVIIYGETGTGKELAAYAIHNFSKRVIKPFIKVNAASILPELMDSELFGYEEGAFAGAAPGGKKGKLELADGGTLFIDEVQLMPLSIQAKIFYALQENEFEKLGSERVLPIDIRIIASTSKDLARLVQQGEFREDLYYRLRVFQINMPNLRERKEDIPELVMNKIGQLNKDLGKNVIYVDKEVYDYILQRDWPGNIRELYSEVERAMSYANGETLTLSCFYNDDLKDIANLSADQFESFNSPIKAALQATERGLILDTLNAFNGNKTKTAKYLKISRTLLYQKMRRLGISTQKSVV